MAKAADQSDHGVSRLMLDLRQMKSFSQHPLVISRGDGCYCYDVNGKRYIEGVSGIYVTNIGHGNRHVLEAIRKQQEKISFVGPLHAVSDIAVQYAAKLASVAPTSMG